VEDASSTVTVCPTAVNSVKLDVNTLATVPAAPPAAGPDRALDPPLLERPTVPLLLPQAARIVVAAKKSKVTLTTNFRDRNIRRASCIGSVSFQR